MMNYKITFKFLITLVSLCYVSCTIDGSFNPYSRNLTRDGEDPCNPLYWYPRKVPKYCFYTTTIRPKPIIRPIIPMPIPIPLPPPPFYPPMYPPPMMPVMPPPAPPPGMPPHAVPIPVMAPPIPLPFGIPIAPSNPMIPVAGIQYNPFQPPYPMPPPPRPMPVLPSPPMPVMPPMPQNQISMQPQSQVGMVPGLPGMVSYDGGINIMPFSDAYADLLERHKQKMIRRRLQKFLDEYDKYPWKDRSKR